MSEVSFYIVFLAIKVILTLLVLFALLTGLFIAGTVFLKWLIEKYKDKINGRIPGDW
jgi:hypothetical protein